MSSGHPSATATRSVAATPKRIREEAIIKIDDDKPQEPQEKKQRTVQPVARRIPPPSSTGTAPK